MCAMYVSDKIVFGVEGRYIVFDMEYYWIMIDLMNTVHLYTPFMFHDGFASMVKSSTYTDGYEERGVFHGFFSQWSVVLEC